MPDNTQYQRVKEITDQLEQGIQDMFNSEQYMTWLRTMSKFHDYSLNNTLLICFQKPDATLVAGYTAWQKQFGRQVQKGEKAIRIIAPSPYKDKVEMEKIDPSTQKPVLDKDGNPVMETQVVMRPAFKVVSVFDVSQTEGPELPTIGVDELTGDVEQFQKFFSALRLTCPVPMTFEQIESGAKGYYHQVDRRIAIQEGMSDLQTLKTAIHEMAHQKLHAIDPDAKLAGMPHQSRNSKEVEAESVAYTVCQHFGIDTSDYSFAYIAGWSHGKDTPELKASLQTIRKAASEMISDIERNMKEIERDWELSDLFRGKDETAVRIEDAGYLEIHITGDVEWDYTLYDSAFQQVDGGRIGEGQDISLAQACKEILADYGYADRKLVTWDGSAVPLSETHEQIWGNPDYSPEQVDFMVELASSGYDLSGIWIAGKPTDLTEYPLSPEDVADIKYQYEASGIPKAFYTSEQWHQIQAGLKEQLDFHVFADPAYSPQQMEALQGALAAEAKGFVTRDDVMSIANPAMAPVEMKTALRAAFKAHQAEQSAAKESTGLQENGMYRYYSTQRPIAPGTYPKGDNAPVKVENFDSRSPVEGGKMQAWGYLEYRKPLTAAQQANYELKPAASATEKIAARTDKPGKKKSVLADLRAKQAQVEQGKRAATQTHTKSKEMEQA